MKTVIDASVAVKWIIRDSAVEMRAGKAVAILRAIRSHTIEVLAPQHWPIEVLEVIARIRQQQVLLTVGIFESLPYTTVAAPEILRRAATMAVHLNRHLFDTLYHAVALEEGAILVTADRLYFDKAKNEGAIVFLADFTL
ncbi:MAG: type II toxin-antitoxin system VapC family toxin [Hyphomicrobiaceae bacterium]